MWPMLPRAPQQPWFSPQQPLSIPMPQAVSTLTQPFQQPLFPIQNMIPGTTAAMGLQPAFQAAASVPPPTVSQPLFPIATSTVVSGPTTNGSSVGPVNPNNHAGVAGTASNQGMLLCAVHSIGYFKYSAYFKDAFDSSCSLWIVHFVPNWVLFVVLYLLFDCIFFTF
jgi:hypothetical protein